MSASGGYTVTRSDPDATAHNVWTIGLMLVLMGMVIAAFAYFRKKDSD